MTGSVTSLLDRRQRPLRDLRVSVTDRCNLRCSYCMPAEQYEWLARGKILTFEEIRAVVEVFLELGVERIRLTGGEPLLRRGLPQLVEMLSSLPGLRELSLTTNAVLLSDHAPALKAAGLRRINVSLDTLDPDRFARLTRRDALGDVLDGIEAARSAGFAPLKINMVVERGLNDDEILPMARFCRREGHHLRFIEFMDVGNSNRWDLSRVVPASEILELLQREFPLKTGRRDRSSDPELCFAYEDAPTDAGIIASVTRPFCGQCTRARLTADGRLVTCLFSSDGTDLKGPLRRGASPRELRELVQSVWRGRLDQFSLERRQAILSGHGYDPADHKKIEMISLGG